MLFDVVYKFEQIDLFDAVIVQEALPGAGEIEIPGHNLIQAVNFLNDKLTFVSLYLLRQSFGRCPDNHKRIFQFMRYYRYHPTQVRVRLVKIKLLLGAIDAPLQQ